MNIWLYLFTHGRWAVGARLDDERVRFRRWGGPYEGGPHPKNGRSPAGLRPKCFSVPCDCYLSHWPGWNAGCGFPCWPGAQSGGALEFPLTGAGSAEAGAATATAPTPTNSATAKIAIARIVHLRAAKLRRLQKSGVPIVLESTTLVT